MVWDLSARHACHGKGWRRSGLYSTLCHQHSFTRAREQDKAASNRVQAASRSQTLQHCNTAHSRSPYPASCAASPGARFLYLSNPGAWLMWGSCSGVLLSAEPACRRACMLESCWSVGWLVVANTELRPVSPSNTWRTQQHGNVGMFKSRKYHAGLPCRQDNNLASLRKHTIGHFGFCDLNQVLRCLEHPAVQPMSRHNSTHSRCMRKGINNPPTHLRQPPGQVLGVPDATTVPAAHITPCLITARHGTRGSRREVLQQSCLHCPRMQQLYCTPPSRRMHMSQVARKMQSVERCHCAQGHR
jgi:hypothetical protein